MKKKKIENYIYNNSEDAERQYQQKLKADQSMLQAFFNAFSQYYYVPFYPYSYPMLPQTDLLVEQPEDNVNMDCSKNIKTNNCAKVNGNHTHLTKD